MPPLPNLGKTLMRRLGATYTELGQNVDAEARCHLCQLNWLVAT